MKYLSCPKIKLSIIHPLSWINLLFLFFYLYREGFKFYISINEHQ